MTRIPSSLSMCFVGGVMVALFAGPALAQDAPEPASPNAEEAVQIEHGAFVIRGKVQKPEVVVSVSRRTVEQDFDLGLDQTFLKQIISSVREQTFDK